VLVEGALYAFFFVLGFATVGLVLMLRRPANPIGWLYGAAGLAWAYTIPLGPWVDRLLSEHRPLPMLAQLDVALSEFGWAAAIGLGVTLPALLLPNGQLRSRRWRLVVVTSVTGLVLATVGGALAPGPIEVAGLLLSLPSGLGLLPNYFSHIVFPALLLPPVAIGVAVLRYRLYDLDRVISRTLTYGLLTVLLGLGYAGLVLGLGRLLPEGSSLVVAAATLAVAALFQPLRRRVQQLVDRRFNRRRYDAAWTVDGFATRLRDQVDLDALHGELLAVVDQTVQPTQASLWLRHAP
jgi:hypothetical protein